VSKFHPASSVLTLAKQGQVNFGENYVQEMLEKIKHVDQETHPPLKWHFIGPLQSNKCKEVAFYADSIHSLDRLKLVEPLARLRPIHLPPLNVYLQVNIDDEQSKSGVKDWESLKQLAQTVLRYERLTLCGLMVIPTPCHDPIMQRKPFAQLRKLKERLSNELGVDLPSLSMGMSADLEAAIQEGSTIVRVGTDIFGSRPQQSSIN
jgi:pyridoxal phosphate enzyme (YggS family)